MAKSRIPPTALLVLVLAWAACGSPVGPPTSGGTAGSGGIEGEGGTGGDATGGSGGAGGQARECDLPAGEDGFVDPMAWLGNPDCWIPRPAPADLDGLCSVESPSQIPPLRPASWMDCGDGCQQIDPVLPGTDFDFGVRLMRGSIGSEEHAFASIGSEFSTTSEVQSLRSIVDLSMGSTVAAFKIDASFQTSGECVDPVGYTGFVNWFFGGPEGRSWSTFTLFRPGQTGFVWFPSWLGPPNASSQSYFEGDPIDGQIPMFCPDLSGGNCLVDMDGSQLRLPEGVGIGVSNGRALFWQQRASLDPSVRTEYVLTWQPGDALPSPLLQRPDGVCLLTASGDDLAGTDGWPDSPTWCGQQTGTTLWLRGPDGDVKDYPLRFDEPMNLDDLAAGDEYTTVYVAPYGGGAGFFVVTREDGAQRRIEGTYKEATSSLVLDGWLYVAEALLPPRPESQSRTLLRIRRYDLARWEALGQAYP